MQQSWRSGPLAGNRTTTVSSVRLPPPRQRIALIASSSNHRIVSSVAGLDFKSADLCCGKNAAVTKKRAAIRHKNMKSQRRQHTATAKCHQQKQVRAFEIVIMLRNCFYYWPSFLGRLRQPLPAPTMMKKTRKRPLKRQNRARECQRGDG